MPSYHVEVADSSSDAAEAALSAPSWNGYKSSYSPAGQGVGW